MRLLWLYAKARGGPQCVAWLLLIGVAAVLLALVDTPQPTPAHRTPSVSWMVVLSLASALGIGATTMPSGGAIERLSVQPLWLLRGLFTIGLLTVAGALWNVLRQVLDPDQAWMFGRNLLGFAGLSWLAAAALGAPLHWTAPLMIASASFFLPSSAVHPEWAEIVLGWPLQPGSDMTALMIAFGLLLAGWSLYIGIGADRMRQQ